VAYLVRVVIALAGGVAALAMLLMLLAFFLADEPVARGTPRAPTTDLLAC
jgi:hypothetical protein